MLFVAPYRQFLKPSRERDAVFSGPSDYCERCRNDAARRRWSHTVASAPPLIVANDAETTPQSVVGHTRLPALPLIVENDAETTPHGVVEHVDHRVTELTDSLSNAPTASGPQRCDDWRLSKVWTFNQVVRLRNAAIFQAAHCLARY